jgi:hypothetical protein
MQPESNRECQTPQRFETPPVARTGKSPVTEAESVELDADPWAEDLAAVEPVATTTARTGSAKVWSSHRWNLDRRSH